MKTYGRKIYGAALILACFLCVFSGCNNKTGGQGEGILGGGKEKELPEDTPWNHGIDAIMETEGGWYSSFCDAKNYRQTLCLRYYDKETGETVLLCNKPECQHLGDDTCEATYGNVHVINTLIYEDAIYVLAAEGATNHGEKVGSVTSVNLYKAALDGSAIDKVGCVISSEVPTDYYGLQDLAKIRQADMFEEIRDIIDYSFIIHKGFAYIPYYLRFGTGTAGFRGGGLAKMDIKTGEVKILYETTTIHQGVPAFLTAKGDYVWFRVYGNFKGSRIKRIDVTKDEVEDFYGRLSEDAKDTISLSSVLPFEDRVYDLSYNLDEKMNQNCWTFRSYDLKTGEYHPEESFDTDVSCKQGGITSAFVYEEKIIFGNLYGCYCYDRQGNKVAEISFPQEQVGLTFKRGTTSVVEKDARYKISGGELYLIFADTYMDPRYRNNSQYDTAYRRRVFTCPMSDFLSGNGSWTERFTIEGHEVPENPGWENES